MSSLLILVVDWSCAIRPVALQRITDAAGVSLILILSDINMPGVSGLCRRCDRIRRLSRCDCSQPLMTHKGRAPASFTHQVARHICPG
jgi:CheY-like chemotaxis protein